MALFVHTQAQPYWLHTGTPGVQWQISPAQHAGMGCLGGIMNGVGVMMDADGMGHFYFDERGTAHPQSEPVLTPKSTVWIRLSIDAPRQQHQFSYSVDGKHFTPLGSCFREWSHGWKGTHISLYTYTTGENAGGTAYFDDFVYQTDGINKKNKNTK